MRIGIVGGVERNEGQYRAVAERLGHEVAFHSGHVGGRGSDSLTGLVYSVDLVIILTDVNSHGAVSIARKAAKRRGTAVELHRRCSPSRLASLVSSRDSLLRPAAAPPGTP